MIIEWWLPMTPLGMPVVPPLNSMSAVSDLSTLTAERGEPIYFSIRSLHQPSPFSSLTESPSFSVGDFAYVSRSEAITKRYIV
jgi:hypothetical protein